MARPSIVTNPTVPFELSGTLPEGLAVRDLSPSGDATRLYGVVADYGWAERILFSGAYLREANGIATVLGEALGVPVLLAETPDA